MSDDLIDTVVSQFPTFLGLVVLVVVLLRENQFRREEIQRQDEYIKELTKILVDRNVLTGADIAHIRPKDYRSLVPPRKRNDTDFN